MISKRKQNSMHDSRTFFPNLSWVEMLDSVERTSERRSLQTSKMSGETAKRLEKGRSPRDFVTTSVGQKKPPAAQATCLRLQLRSRKLLSETNYKEPLPYWAAFLYRDWFGVKLNCIWIAGFECNLPWLSTAVVWWKLCKCWRKIAFELHYFFPSLMVTDSSSVLSLRLCIRIACLM